MSTATLLREYHRSLDEATTERGLHVAGGQFLISQDKAMVAAALKQMRVIYAAHRARTRGDGSPAACDEALARALKEIGNA